MKRLMIITAVAVSAAVLISACGSSATSSSTGGAAASSSGTSAGASRRATFAACLKRHGVTLPSRPAGAGGYGPSAGGGAPPAGGGAPPAGTGQPGGGGFFGGGFGGARSTKLRAAIKACGGGRFPSGGFRRRAFNKTTLTAFVACVRKHGYTLPAPNTSGTGSVFPSRIRTDPKFVAASRPCASLLARPAAPAG